MTITSPLSESPSFPPLLLLLHLLLLLLLSIGNPKKVSAGDTMCVSIEYTLPSMTVVSKVDGSVVIPAGSVNDPSTLSQQPQQPIVLQLSLQLFPSPPLPTAALYPGYYVPIDTAPVVGVPNAPVLNTTLSSNHNTTAESTAVENNSQKTKPRSNIGSTNILLNVSYIEGPNIVFCGIVSPTWPSGTMYLSFQEPMFFYDTTLVTEAGGERDPAAEFVPLAIAQRPLLVVDNQAPYVVKVYSPNVTQVQTLFDDDDDDDDDDDTAVVRL